MLNGSNTQPPVSLNDLERLRRIMADLGCSRVYVKALAVNDDSKKQIYFGSGFESLNLLPFTLVEPAVSSSRSTFHGRLSLSWIGDDGKTCPAPRAQLILYPQYPEVRFSGFLKGCANAPSKAMAYGAGHKIPKRLLFLGIHPDGSIFAFLAWGSNPIIGEFNSLSGLEQTGVFFELPMVRIKDTRSDLLAKLRHVYERDWIAAARLHLVNGIVHRGPCNGSNCGGYTLEAELDITPNAYSEPDYLGWEVKQHAVKNFDTLTSGPITLFTPEPQDGYYKRMGAMEFVRKFGYHDQRGRAERMNFGGIYRVGIEQIRTRLTMKLEGYDQIKEKIVDARGGIVLVSQEGEIAAKWPFSHLIAHWNRKHAKAVYVPSMRREANGIYRYHYGPKVRLGLQTDFRWFLAAMAAGVVYLDPAVKVENISSRPKLKCRNQFRIKSADIPHLYNKVEAVDLLTGAVTLCNGVHQRSKNQDNP